MQLWSTSPESQFPTEYSGVTFIQIDQQFKKLLQKYKGVPILWNTVYDTAGHRGKLNNCFSAYLNNRNSWRLYPAVGEPPSAGYRNKCAPNLIPHRARVKCGPADRQRVKCGPKFVDRKCRDVSKMRTIIMRTKNRKITFSTSIDRFGVWTKFGLVTDRHTCIAMCDYQISSTLGLLLWRVSIVCTWKNIFCITPSPHFPALDNYYSVYIISKCDTN